ncbi:MAG: amidase, partial [Acidobacteriota bacterium]
MSREDLFESLGLDRRRFLTVGALAAAAHVVGCQTPSAPAPEAQTDPASAPFDLAEVDLGALADGLGDGRYTSRSLVEAYLGRIEALNHRGPTLRAVIETDPKALEIADALDAERSQGTVRGPLHGIPILLKDNIATHDGTTTTAGSLALAGSKPTEDAFLAARLREAGAVLIGKANLSEWANFRSTRSSSGWSGRGGQCRNPYSLDRTPCGSSSGSGVAVAANMVAAAVGTETNGSIVCPSSHNGIVGLKPTVGLVSRTGVIPISSTQDTAGPMTRSVKGAAILLGAMAGADPKDPAGPAAAEHIHADYTQFLGDGDLSGVRLGVSRGHFGFDPNVDARMEEALAKFSELGAELVDPVELPGFQDLGDSSYQLMLYEFKAGLNEYFASLGDDAPIKSLDELIEWNQANADASMPYFGQEILEQAAEKGDLSDEAYLEARAKALRIMRKEGIDKVIAEHNLDAFVAPTNGPSWRIDLVNGDNFGGGSSTPAAVAGYPTITVPAGFVHGLPVGVSIFS